MFIKKSTSKEAIFSSIQRSFFFSSSWIFRASLCSTDALKKGVMVIEQWRVRKCIFFTEDINNLNITPHLDEKIQKVIYMYTFKDPLITKSTKYYCSESTTAGKYTCHYPILLVNVLNMMSKLRFNPINLNGPLLIDNRKGMCMYQTTTVMQSDSRILPSGSLCHFIFMYTFTKCLLTHWYAFFLPQL